MIERLIEQDIHSYLSLLEDKIKSQYFMMNYSFDQKFVDNCTKILKDRGFDRSKESTEVLVKTHIRKMVKELDKCNNQNTEIKF